VVLFATADTVRGWLGAGEALAAVVVAAGAGGRATVRVGPVRAGPARQVPGARLPGRAVAAVTLRIGDG
jgi:hypothetical protein